MNIKAPNYSSSKITQGMNDLSPPIYKCIFFLGAQDEPPLGYFPEMVHIEHKSDTDEVQYIFDTKSDALD